jgi:arylsulfatase A-like enzyme
MIKKYIDFPKCFPKLQISTFSQFLPPPMKCLKSYKCAFLLLYSILLGCQSVPKQETQKPNVVIFLSDDQGWGDFSITGNKNIETPNVDKLAKEGAMFNNFYVEAVCSPTRAELLTGRYHLRAGVYSTSAGGERIDLDETTLAQAFKEAGYATAAYGKWHNGMQAPYHPNSRGFDDFYGFCSGHWGSYFSPMLEHNGNIVQGEGFLVDDLTNHGIDFIENNQEHPFLLYLPYNTPHSPMQVPDRWYEKFESMELEKRADNPGDEDVIFTKAALAMCENIDWNVGRVLQKLEELDLEENTIIIYFNDNGPNSWRWNGGMKGRKGSTDEGGVRTPLFIKWPAQIEKGLLIDQLVSVIDLFPTLSALTGIEPQLKNAMDGISLAPLLLEEAPSWKKRYIFNQWKDKISVRSQKYRLDDSGALYDIENDRAQQVDVSQQFPEIRKAHMEARASYIEEIASELPEEDIRPFTIGHPGATFTQIPARDGIAHGQIRRSNRYPNCSFFTNWKSTDDSITWDVEILQEGNFNVTLYYTCPAGDEGALFTLTLGNNSLPGKIETSFDPPLRGMEHDRTSERGESYVKDFKPLNLGHWHLDKGPGQLSIRAQEIPGHTVMDFRLLLFEKLD